VNNYTKEFGQKCHLFSIFYPNSPDPFEGAYSFVRRPKIN
jgi:hypothetical protein